MPEPRPVEADRLTETGRRVIAIEAEALHALAAKLDDTFARAARAMLDARGRVIVSGMGKSGHVARKIAATLASTGTPALFVHPAEASHGDLGMITKPRTWYSFCRTRGRRRSLPISSPTPGASASR
jgi:arabinose-5-phosphate isomerase